MHRLPRPGTLGIGSLRYGVPVSSLDSKAGIQELYVKGGALAPYPTVTQTTELAQQASGWREVL